MHILVLLYFAELSCLCNFLVESVNVIFRPRFCILYSSCHRHWIVSLVIFGIVYAHVQFTLGNFNTLDSIFAHVHQTFCFINKRFCTCANAFLNKFTVRSCEYYTYLHWTLYWMQDNQTATYFLRSRLFTYDIMKKLNCN
jgi:hypothetical protein